MQTEFLSGQNAKPARFTIWKPNVSTLRRCLGKNIDGSDKPLALPLVESEKDAISSPTIPTVEGVNPHRILTVEDESCDSSETVPTQGAIQFFAEEMKSACGGKAGFSNDSKCAPSFSVDIQGTFTRPDRTRKMNHDL